MMLTNGEAVEGGRGKGVAHLFAIFFSLFCLFLKNKKKNETQNDTDEKHATAQHEMTTEQPANRPTRRQPGWTATFSAFPFFRFLPFAGTACSSPFSILAILAALSIAHSGALWMSYL